MRSTSTDRKGPVEMFTSANGTKWGPGSSQIDVASVTASVNADLRTLYAHTGDYGLALRAQLGIVARCMVDNMLNDRPVYKRFADEYRVMDIMLARFHAALYQRLNLSH